MLSLCLVCAGTVDKEQRNEGSVIQVALLYVAESDAGASDVVDHIESHHPYKDEQRFGIAVIGFSRLVRGICLPIVHRFSITGSYMPPKKDGLLGKDWSGASP